MQTVLGMIAGALFLVFGMYVYDSLQTSRLASGDVAQTNRTIVNWDVVASDWHVVKTRIHADWVRIASR